MLDLVGAYKAVQIRRAAFVDKGRQPELRYNKAKLPQILFMPGAFEFKLTEFFNAVLHKQAGLGFLKL